MTNYKREIYLVKKLINDFNLNLQGLNVITECASGSYLLSPLAVCLSGGRAICVGKDSSYGLFEDIKKKIN